MFISSTVINGICRVPINRGVSKTPTPTLPYPQEPLPFKNPYPQKPIPIPILVLFLLWETSFTVILAIQCQKIAVFNFFLELK